MKAFFFFLGDRQQQKKVFTFLNHWLLDIPFCSCNFTSALVGGYCDIHILAPKVKTAITFILMVLPHFPLQKFQITRLNS